MKKNLQLWMLFTVIIIAIMIVNFVLVGGLAFAFYRSRIPPSDKVTGIFPFVVTIVSSILVSTAMTIIVSRQFFIPIDALNKALRQVAAGDFTVRLPEGGTELSLGSMNKNFNKMVNELNSIEMLQSDFIQNVSHEFKTPLASIEGYTSLLEDQKLPDELRYYTQKIRVGTQQLSTLTGNILHLSKLENQQIISEKRCYSLDEQLRQSILSLETLWERKKLTIHMNLEEVMYYGNDSLMNQVWINLFSNAIKFTPENGIVSVRSTLVAGGIQVIVQDSGIGMDKDVQKHIFDKFYQAGRGRNTEGNGLGLTLVKKIITLCNGTIVVDSALDAGTTFTIWLPEH